MPLWSGLKHEVVDIIEFAAPAADCLVFRFPRFHDQIKYGAKLIVREGQAAVFVNEGKLADVFAPGTYTLETRNLPVLSTLQSWKYGFDSPFKAEIYFLSTRPVLNLEWGTQQPVTMEAPGFGLVQVRAFGQTSYRIADAQVFFRQVVGATNVLMDNDLRDYLRGIIVGRFSQALTEAKPTLEQLQAHLSELGDTLVGTLNERLAPFGFELLQFVVESLSLPPDQRQELFRYSRLNNVDMSKLTQFEVANSIGTLARNTGVPGAGGGIGAIGGQAMQLGAGLIAAQQVARMMDGAMGSLGQTPASVVPGSASPSSSEPLVTAPAMATTPPSTAAARPPALYHVALDGKAQGPFSADQIAAMTATGSVTAATLVWHPGMTAWAAAGTEPGLLHLFPQQPPPLP
ncbi:SPFH domain-containing protein [Terriglobus sp.]|uniref:SPFH domain-containing protein n=1 Tax=Terriglobus sp. TaxID=1889013 RepID=UPI003B003E99